MWQQTLNGSIFLALNWWTGLLCWGGCWQDFHSGWWWWKTTMFTHIIVFSCVDLNVAGSIHVTKIGFMLFPLFLSRNMDISSRDIRKWIWDGFLPSLRVWNGLGLERLLPQKRSSVWCFSASNKSYHAWQDIISEGVCLPERASKDKWTHEYHLPFPFFSPNYLMRKKDSVSFQMPKSKSHARQIRSVFVFLLLSLFILKFRR